MISIHTDSGLALNHDESREYIKWKVGELFGSLDEFKTCKEIHHSSFWGECKLAGSELEYKDWIIKIARAVLIARKFQSDTQRKKVFLIGKH